MTRHPKTGLSYIHVIPESWGAHVDIHDAYMELSSRLPYVSVQPSETFNNAYRSNNALYQDSNVMYVLWDFMIDPGPKDKRKALVAGVYSEAIGDRDKMLPAHINVLDKFVSRSANFDALFAHTPWMVSKVHELTKLPTYLLPVGWSPQISGVPRVNPHKHNRLAYYGSTVGRRSLLVPYVAKKVDRFIDLSGRFGRQLLGDLELVQASLYVAHSSVLSYSTWRIWQTIPTLTALITEGGDMWPADPEHHVAKIPTFSIDNADMVIDEIIRYLNDEDLVAIARRAHDELGPLYTVDKCMEMLATASETILQGRSTQ